MEALLGPPRGRLDLKNAPPKSARLPSGTQAPPEIVGFGGLSGPLLPGNHRKRRGAKPRTFSNRFPVWRGPFTPPPKPAISGPIFFLIRNPRPLGDKDLFSIADKDFYVAARRMAIEF